LAYGATAISGVSFSSSIAIAGQTPMNSGRQYDRLRNLARRQQWLGPFLQFIDKLRIDSKEVAAEDERGSRLDLWTSQIRFLEQLGEGMARGQRMFYCLKSRQAGISTITLALLLFWVAARPRTIAALVCNTDEVRDAFRNMLERYVRSFPPNFFGSRFVKDRHNEKHYLFSNGSRIDYLVAGKNKVNWGESRGYSVCLCTEVADYGKKQGIENFIEALAQTHPDRLFLLESTAKGPNHWQEMWYDAEDEVTICKIFLGWWAHELNFIRRSDPRFAKFGAHLPNGEETELCNAVLERFGHVVTMEQLAWWRWKLANSDRQSTEQNNPWLPEQAFVLSGYSFFQTRLLQDRYEEIYKGNAPFKAYRFVMGNSFWSMQLEQITDPARGDEIELKVYEDPIREAQYVIGCDPAYGHSEDSDSHCIVVFRCYADRLVQVAEYAEHRFETKHCAWILAGLAGAYRSAMINLELYGPGRIVMNEFDNIRQQLRQEMYNPLNEQNGWDEDFMSGARWFLYRRIDNPGPGFVYCFETTQKRKFELFNLFRDVFTSKILVINSVKMLEEMANMVQEKSDIAPQAPGRQHDDRPFAGALAAYAWNEWIRNPLIAVGATYDRITAAEQGHPEGPSAIVDRLVYTYLSRREEEAMEREEAGGWAQEDWRAQRGFL
jgi:hypothetical protein